MSGLSPERVHLVSDQEEEGESNEHGVHEVSKL